MSSSHVFIQQVLAAADEARMRPPHERARKLARFLVQAFVPDLIVCGFDLRRWIAPGIYAAAPPTIDSPASADDLRAELTAGGQGDEAYRHLAAAAAAVLAGRRALVVFANLLDWAQGIARGNRREARAEVAGNRTGAQLGHALRAYLDGAVTREALETSMVDLLT